MVGQEGDSLITLLIRVPVPPGVATPFPRPPFAQGISPRIALPSEVSTRGRVCPTRPGPQVRWPVALPPLPAPCAHALDRLACVRLRYVAT